jgi:hypothetical protein
MAYSNPDIAAACVLTAASIRPFVDGLYSVGTCQSVRTCRSCTNLELSRQTVVVALDHSQIPWRRGESPETWKVVA